MTPRREGVWAVVGAGLLTVGLLIGLLEVGRVVGTDESTESALFDPNPFGHPIEWFAIVLAAAGAVVLMIASIRVARRALGGRRQPP